MMTKMLREHFNIIATVLHANKPQSNYDECFSYWEGLVADMAKALQQTNPRFDIERFRQACNSGVQNSAK